LGGKYLDELELELAELNSKRASLILKVNALRSILASGVTVRPQSPLLGRPILASNPGSNAETGGNSHSYGIRYDCGEKGLAEVAPARGHGRE
jgi:hypothetical protein